MQFENFQLIDRVADLSLAERRLRAEAAVPTTSTIFEAHFPGYPLMPGVLLVESMAQASGWLMIALSRFERMAFLAQVRKAKLREFVRPGANLTIDVGLLHQGSGFVVTRGKVAAGDKIVCEGELTLRMLPFASEDLRNRMKQLAARIDFPMDVLVDA